MRRTLVAALLPPLLLAGGAETPKPEDVATAVSELGRNEYATRRAAAGRLLAAGTASIPPLIEALKKSEETVPLRMPALAILDDARAGRPPQRELRHLLSRITGQSFRTSGGWSAWWKERSGKDPKALVGAEIKAAVANLSAKAPWDRRCALDVLARIGNEGHADEAAAGLLDKDVSVKIGACRALAELGRAKAAEGLKDLLASKNPHLRLEALEAATLLQIKDAKPVLIGMLANAKHPLERARAVENLARFADPAALSAAAASLGHWSEKNAQIRYCTALSYYPTEKAVEALRNALADPKTDNPVMLAGALAVLGDRSPAAVSAVGEALKAALPAPNPKEPDRRVLARQRRLFAARIVADVFSTHSDLRNAANGVFREFASDLNASVDRGVKALKGLQQKESKGKGEGTPGAWPFQSRSWSDPGFRPGPSALALLALRKSGVPGDDPDFVRGMKYVRDCAAKPPAIGDATTYAQAMMAMLLAEVDPVGSRESVKRIVDWLQGCQITPKTDPFKAGQWSYVGNQFPQSTSNSVTHYTLLGLCFPSRALKDLPVRKEIWQASLDYFRRAQTLGGGWTYGKGLGVGDAYGNMTAAGVTSLLICQAGLMGDGFQDFDALGFRPIRDGLDWLGDRFADAEVPEVASAMNTMINDDGLFYWTYTIERMALLLGTDYIGNRHWYHDLASRLLEIQEPSGGWNGGPRGAAGELPAVATSFALLTLKRASLPADLQIQIPRTYGVEEAPIASSDVKAAP